MKISTNGTDFSRYEHDRRTLELRLRELTVGAAFTLELTREDSARVILASGTITPTATEDAYTFDLGAKAADGICYVNRGRYVVIARDEDGVEVARSRSIYVLPITPQNLIDTYLFGVPLHAEDVLMAVRQPWMGGVGIRYIDPYMLRGPGGLVYTHTGRTFTWRGGAAVPVVGDDIQLLRLLTPTQDAYLEIEVDPDMLPGANATNELLIDNLRMSHDRIREEIFDAADHATSDLHLTIEPTIVSSDADDGLGPYDFLGEALPREPNQQRTIQFPGSFGRPLLRVVRLEGWYANQKALTIPQDWITVERKAGMVTFVPITGSALLQTTGFGAIWGLNIGRIGGNSYLPNFWHYRIVAGLESLDGAKHSIRELIAKRAALKILENLSLGASAGRTNRSAQRDGVSENWSYGGQGAYGEKITAYREWLDREIPRARQYHGGMEVIVL